MTKTTQQQRMMPSSAALQVAIAIRRPKSRLSPLTAKQRVKQILLAAARQHELEAAKRALQALRDQTDLLLSQFVVSNHQNEEEAAMTLAEISKRRNEERSASWALFCRELELDFARSN